MDVTISCDTFSRFARVARFEATPDDLRKILVVIKDKKAFAVATTRKVAVLELLTANVEQPEGAFLLAVDVPLIKQAEIEKQFHGSFNVIYNAMLGFASLKSSMGFTQAGVGAAVPDGSDFLRWEEWFPREFPNKSHGSLYFASENLAVLAECAPTGCLVFPAVIDNRKPVIVCDVVDDSWIGSFMSYRMEPNGKPKEQASAELPHWWKV